MSNFKHSRLSSATCLTVAAGCLAAAVPLHAATMMDAQSGADQPPASASDSGEIIVTANKREETARDVPMSLTTASGEQLLTAGITTPLDLPKIVPGLTVQPSPFNTPVYTMRGIGFYETSLSAAPTVAVYVDEVPLPFSATTKLAVLDLQRVEVLKGPQGTLFGQNTTGGAINYVAAKPTDSFQAGADLSLSRFSTYDLQGFVSGPIAPNLAVRVAGRIVQGGAWQKSFTRNDELGKTKQFQVRTILQWTPSDDLTVRAMLSAWQDKGDTQAPQLLESSCGTSSAGLCSNSSAVLFKNYPLPARNNRMADWGDGIYGRKNARDDNFFQGSLRIEKDLSDNVQLISMTSYSEYKTDSVQDFDGTTLDAADNNTTGYIHAFSQELRLTGNFDNLRLSGGVNYDNFNVYDKLFYNIERSYTADLFWLDPDQTAALPKYTYSYTHQRSKSYAAFFNAEYSPIDQVKITAGARYTNVKRAYDGCSFPLGVTADWFNRVFGSSLESGECSVFAPPGSGTLFFDPVMYDNLNEDNISWNLVADYKFTPRSMIYARVAKGYKAGSFPTSSTVSYAGLLPVSQESVLTYEVGLKSALPGGLGEVTLAGFYNDYRNKQLRSRKPDDLFVTLDGLVQIPKSWSKGVEASLLLRPVQGLTLSGGGTYLETRVVEYNGYDPVGVPTNFKGQRFPYAPRWSLVGDAEYRFPVTSSQDAYLGISAMYNSATSSVLSNKTTEFATADDRQVIKAYGLVDLRGGVEFDGGNVKVGFFVRNLFDKYYWTNALDSLSTIVRFTGMPRTYGLQLSWRN